MDDPGLHAGTGVDERPVHRGLATLMAVISIVFVPFGVNTFFPNFPESILPMQIMSIALIPATVFMIQEAEFFGKEKSRIVLIGRILQTGTYFLLILSLGQSFGLIGLAVGFLASIIFRITFNFFVTLYLQKTKPE